MNFTFNPGVAIRIDEKKPVCYGYVRKKGVEYPTVTLYLRSSEYMMDIQEYNRKYEQFEPLLMWDYGNHTLKSYHDIWAEIWENPVGKIGIRITYIADERPHTIPLTGEDRFLVLMKINDQCRKLYGKTCRQMFTEARKRMGPKEEDMS